MHENFTSRKIKTNRTLAWHEMPRRTRHRKPADKAKAVSTTNRTAKLDKHFPDRGPCDEHRQIQQERPPQRRWRAAEIAKM